MMNPGPRPTRIRSPRGYSLIEVMFAVLIQVVAILAIIGVFPMMAKADKGAWLASVALYHAQEQMDKLLLASTKISTATQTDYPSDLPSGYRQWVGSTDAGNSGVQTITVTVTWVEEGRVHSLSLDSTVDP